MEMNPVTENPKQAIKGARGRNHPIGRLSERCPNTGWMIEEVRFAERIITPDIVYDRFKASLKKGRMAGRAPWLRSVQKWPALRRTNTFLFILILFPF